MKDEKIVAYVKLLQNVERPNLEECWSDGYQIALSGGDETVNPYEEASAEGQQWLDGWWAATAAGRPDVGEVIHLHFGDLVTLSFRIEGLTENAQVRLLCVAGPHPWQDCLLTFALRQDEGQVWVRLDRENAQASDDDFLYFNTKWPCYLLSLKALVETGRGCPYPNEAKIRLGD